MGLLKYVASKPNMRWILSENNDKFPESQLIFHFLSGKHMHESFTKNTHNKYDFSSILQIKDTLVAYVYIVMCGIQKFNIIFLLKMQVYVWFSESNWFEKKKFKRTRSRGRVDRRYMLHSNGNECTHKITLIHSIHYFLQSKWKCL